MKKGVTIILSISIGIFFLVWPGTAHAVTDCVFTFADSTMTLQGDCMTDTTISIPAGYTLNGNDYTITAHDPTSGHFVGGIIANAGNVAHVTKLTLDTENLSNVCDAGGNRLWGILFEGASGSITHTNVLNINQGPSGCQEGNAIEARNAPFDGTHPNTQVVEVGHNVVDAYQKSGIVCNGDMNCQIHHNDVGASATQQNLAANGIQVAFGADGMVEHNRVSGNQWLGASDYAASAILLYSIASEQVEIVQNNVGGNADVGIFGVGSATSTNLVQNNRVFDTGEDGPHGDFGLVNFGAQDLFNNNKVRGYDTPLYGDGTKTKVIPSPHDPGSACFLPDTSSRAC